ncbi:MAG TPA: hypothetical protein VGG16_02845 [Streptosporangiaceae bacterium]
MPVAVSPQRIKGPQDGTGRRDQRQHVLREVRPQRRVPREPRPRNRQRVQRRQRVFGADQRRGVHQRAERALRTGVSRSRQVQPGQRGAGRGRVPGAEVRRPADRVAVYVHASGETEDLVAELALLPQIQHGRHRLAGCPHVTAELVFRGELGEGPDQPVVPLDEHHLTAG